MTPTPASVFRRALCLVAGSLAVAQLGAADSDPYAINPFKVQYRTAPSDPKVRWAGFRSRVGTYLPTDPYHYWRFDIRNRAEVQDAFWNIQAPGDMVAADWTGSADVTPGDVKQAWRNAMMRTYNLHRYYYMGASTTYVEEDADPVRRRGVQAAALFQGIRPGGFKHLVTASEFPAGFPNVEEAIVYSKISNIGPSDYPSDITTFIADPGNPWPGHRLTLLDTGINRVAFGQAGNVPRPVGTANPIPYPTNVLFATDTNTIVQSGNRIGALDANAVPTAPTFDPFERKIVYPYNGYITSYDTGTSGIIIISLQVPGAGLQLDLSNTEVSVTRDGTASPITDFGYTGTTSYNSAVFFTARVGALLVPSQQTYRDTAIDITISGIRFGTTSVLTPGGNTSRDGPAYLAASDARAFQPHTLSWSYTIFDPTTVQGAPFPVPTSSVTNLSTRATVGTNDDALIAGFIIAGDEPLRVAIRAQGPSLSKFGIRKPARNPRVQLFQIGGGEQPTFDLGGNDNWQAGPNWRLVQSFGLNPGDPKESVGVAWLAPGNYTAVVTDDDRTDGVGIVELFAIDAESQSRLANVSTRARIGQDEAALIAGFILQRPTTLVIRTQSPSLARYGLSTVTATKLRVVRQSDQALLAVNTGWNAAEAEGNQRFFTDLASYRPGDSREAAQIITLPAGAYTALAESTDGTTGVGVVEIFHVESL